MTSKPISIIVAIAQNNAIGKDNDLLWHISEDLKYFKRITSEHTVIMGRKTFESLPFKPLPKRKNIVITKDPLFHFQGCEVAYSIDEVFEFCDNEKENFVIGGGAIYEQFLPYAQKLYITHVYKDFEADIFFPEINKSEWKIEQKSETFFDEKSGLEYAFYVYKKILS